MKHALDRNPIRAHAIAPHAPTTVAEAKAEFDRISLEGAQLKDACRDQEKEAIPAAEARDMTEATDAIAAGKTVTDPEKHARKAKAELATMQGRLRALDVATDLAGNRLAEAIAEHRDAWLAALAPHVDDAVARYEQAIADAKAALVDLKLASGARSWIEHYDAGQARVGNQSQFAGGKLMVENARGQEHDPRVLLELAATVVETVKPPAEPVAA